MMKRYIETKDHEVYCIDDLDVGFSTFITKDGKCISADDVLRIYDEPVKDKVVFKLAKEKIAREDLQQSNFLSTYCKNIEKDYEVNIDLVYDDKEDCYSEAIITGQSRSIQALIYDGMFEDLVDLTNGTTEQIYDEQHGQEYYGPWDW